MPMPKAAPVHRQPATNAARQDMASGVRQSAGRSSTVFMVERLKRRATPSPEVLSSGGQLPAGTATAEDRQADGKAKKRRCAHVSPSGSTSSCVSQPAASSTLSLVSRAETFLRRLDAAEDDTLICTLADLILAEKEHHLPLDGLPLTAASSHSRRLDALERCLSTLCDARKHALSSGGRRPAGTLTDAQFEAAWSWLKQEFRDKWMRNQDIHQQLLDKYAKKLNRKQKSAANKSFRGAFLCFFKSLAGNQHVARAILRHGLDSPAEIKCLLAEYYKYIDSADYTQWLDGQRERRRSRSCLREEAFHARNNFKHARRLQ